MNTLLLLFALLVVAAGCYPLLRSSHGQPADLAREPLHEAPSAAAQETDARSGCALGADCTAVCDYVLPTDEPVYFDDEELDRFVGTDASAYDEAATEEFAEVMHTMRPDEVHTWLRSLERRGVQLPATLREEAFLMME